jgi:hypothetical protein
LGPSICLVHIHHRICEEIANDWQQKVKEIQRIKRDLLTVTSNGSVHSGHLRIVFIACID